MNIRNGGYSVLGLILKIGLFGFSVLDKIQILSKLIADITNWNFVIYAQPKIQDLDLKFWQIIVMISPYHDTS